MLVFTLKATALTAIVGLFGGSILLQNYSLRHVVDKVVVTLSAQHGIETGSINPEPVKPLNVEPRQLPEPTQPGESQKREVPPTVAKRKAMPPKERPWYDRLIDEIDEAIGWKKT
jgi:hypothetical protein